MTNPYGNLQSDKSQRLALGALVDGTSPSMALKQDATTAAGWAGTGSVARSVEDELRDASNPATRYGAVGDGSDTRASLVTAFATVASGGQLFLPPGDYLLSSALSLALSNAAIIGVPGKTRLFASASTQVLRLLACTKVLFYGITFETTRTSAGEDTSTGVVYMNADGAGISHDLTDVAFECCKFSAANCNTNGFKAALSSSTMADSDCSNIAGLSFIDCDFSSIGRMAVELVNNKSGTSKRYSRIRVVRPHCKDIGLSGSYGMGVSLSGPGYDCIVEGGTFDNCYKLALENAGADDVTFRDNRVRNQPAGSGSVGVSSSTTAVAGFKLLGHVDETAAPNQSYLNNVASPTLLGNTLRGSSTTQPVLLVRDVNKLKAIGDRYVGEKYGVYVDASAGTSYDNEWLGCEFDNGGRTGDGACIYFTGSSVARNTVAYSTLIRGSTAEWFTQASGAVDNRLIKSAYATTSGTTATQGFGQVIYTVTGSATMLERDLQSDLITLSGSPASNFTLTIPRVHRVFWVYNGTSQQASFSFGTGTTAAIAAGSRALICVNSTAVSTGCSVIATTTS